MATPSAPSNRASLLAGLRTGGVRSASQPLQVPHTAAPAGSFTIPRIVSSDYSSSNYFPEESEEDDQLAQLAAQSLNLNHNPRHSGIPMTANAADGAMMLQQQQQQLFLRQLAAQQRGGGMYQDQAEVQAQLMQMELLRLQAIQQAQQAQQFQAELYAQAQRQQVNGRGNLRRTSMEPMTAAPSITTFDQRANAAAQLRARAQQAEYRAAMQNNVDDYGPVPMTAAIGGKFGSRGLNPHANSFVAGGFGQMEQQADIYTQNNYMNAPPTPGRVISGGISLGNPNGSTPPPVSKSDAATSWRRTGNNSVLRSASSPLNTKLHRSSPSNDESSPTTKARPKPLKFNSVDSMAIPTVTIDTSNVDEDTSSSSSKGGSPTSASGPATPPSSDTSLTGVESKKSYDGLGIGRQAPVAPAPRHVSMPLRQPKGPPSGADELGPRNFATRLRKQAIGGLGVLVNARERREVAAEVQAF